MPYIAVKRGSEYCVVKEDDPKGKSLGCHPDKGAAHDQMKALYAQEGKTTKEIESLVDWTEVKEKILELSETLPDQEKELAKNATELLNKCGGDYSGYYTPSYVPYGVNSFEELDAWKQTQEQQHEASETLGQYVQIFYNIMGSMDIPDKTKAFKQLSDEFISRIENAVSTPNMEDKAAKRPDVSPADKKRAAEEYGNVKFADPTNKKYPIDTPEHIRAAWNYINKTGNAAKYPDKGASVKRAIIAAWRKKIDPDGPPSASAKEANPLAAWDQETGEGGQGLVEKIVASVLEKIGYEKKETEPTVEPDGTGIMIWKSNDTYFWIARYSNNTRDDDNPPEIIAGKSHKRFVERVEKEIAPLPELWLWHIPEYKWGQATWVAYDETKENNIGFALAGGYVLKGKEAIAEAVAALPPESVCVSHGMPYISIKRDPEDESVIIEHDTKEISPLPNWAAANKATSFAILEVNKMAIPAHKKQILTEQWKVPAEMLDQLESLDASQAKELSDAGIQTKDKEESPAQDQVTTPTPAPEGEAAPTSPVAAAEAPTQEPPITRAEIVEGFQAIVAPILEALEALKGNFNSLQTEVKELQASDAEKVKAQAERVPYASLASMISTSVVGSPEAKVDGRTSLGGAHPKEVAGQDNTPARITGNPIIDGVLAQHNHSDSGRSPQQ